MKAKSITRNFIYDLIYKVITLLIPLVTAPYISRVIGVDGIGYYSYTSSICAYFGLVAILGTNIYGQREIAFCNGNKKQYSKKFGEIYILRVLLICITACIYIFFSFHMKGRVRVLLLLQTVDIICLNFDITWFFQGIEEFGLILYRNIILKTLSVLSIFLFVKTEEDLYWYVFLTSMAVVIGNLSLWFGLKRYIVKVDISLVEVGKHLRPAILLFIPTIALKLYEQIDKTMLGVLSSSSAESGYYELTTKIIVIVITFVTSIGTVLSPRMAALYSQNDEKKIESLLYKSFEIIWALALPVSFGIIAISDAFVPLFFGAGYEKVVLLLRILAIICIPMGLKNIIGIQYFIPTMRERLYTKFILVGLTLNICLNFILIPQYFSIGAAVASIVSETIIVVLQFFSIREKVKLNKVLELCKKKACAAFVMAVVIKLGIRIVPGSLTSLLFLIFVGVLIYSGLLILFHDNITCEALRMVYRKIKNTRIPKKNRI